MKKLLYSFLLLIIFNTNVLADIKLKLIAKKLDSPWSLTFLDKEHYLITEKSGDILIVNKHNGKIKNIKHNLNILKGGQGGLLDILNHNKKIYVSYSENRGDMKSSTSVAVAQYDINFLNFNNIFRASPPINSGYHFGSRLIIKDENLYISAGERGKGIIAQDFTKHPGSIIRINLDGTIPSDNPVYNIKPDWLPEIYLIGIRNVQGMCLSSLDNKIYMTNHGAKGGDWFGEIIRGGNYGWDKLYWGGTKYSGLKGGPKWLPGFDKPIKYYVPSIATSACLIYNGNEFPDWKGDALIAALKDQSIRKLTFKKDKYIKEEIVLKDKIGRIRDIKEDKDGKILILTDQGSLWSLSKK